MKNDEILVAKSINGDHDAFGSLVRQYTRDVYDICLNTTRNPLDAEDLTQEIFIKAYLSLSKLKKPGSFISWLKRIAKNYCIDWLRARQEQYLLFDNLYDENQLLLPSADEKVLHEDLSIALESAMLNLKEEDRKILKLFYIYGFTYNEVIRANGISYSAAASRLHKAKKRLKELISNYASSSETSSEIVELSRRAEYMNLGHSNNILEGIKAVECAQSSEPENRHFLCGVELEYTREDGLRLIATDGRRMAVAQIAGNENESNTKMLIPTDEVELLKEFLGQTNDDVIVEKLDKDLAAFTIGDSKKLVNLIPEDFPEYRQIILNTRSYTESIAVKRKSAVRLMRIAEAAVGRPPLDWIQKGDEIHISQNPDTLEARETRNKSVDLCHTFLKFVAESKSKDVLADKILSHKSREEYQNLLEDLERWKEPPSEPVGILKVLASEGKAIMDSQS